MIQAGFSEQFSALFNQKGAEQLIPYKFTVDWSNPLEGYSEDLESEFYEFSLKWSVGNDPNKLSSSRKALGIELGYRVLAVSNGNSFDFYVARFEGKSIVQEQEVSLTLLNRFDGIYWLYDSSQELMTAKKFINGNYMGVIAWDGLRAWDPNNTLKMEDDSRFSGYRKTVDANSKICNN